MNRGQAHTLEGIVAGMILLASILFALQSTVITPLSASTSNQHIENQHEALARGLLTVTGEDGTMKDALLYWGQEPDATENRFHCASSKTKHYTGNPDHNLCSLTQSELNTRDHLPPNAFGKQLEETYGKGIATNVRLRYLDGSNHETQFLVFQGEPSDNAVSETSTVVLYDSDRLRTSDGGEGAKLKNAEDVFYAPDNWPGERIYNVITVEVTVWRI